MKARRRADFPKKKMKLAISTRRMATAQSGQYVHRKKETNLDPRYTLIKQALYPKSVQKPSPPPPTPKDTPVHTDEFAQKDTIERAWALHQSVKAVEYTESLTKKYRMMRLAMESLAQTDSRLFDRAQDNPIWTRDEALTLFPARLRVPTETPPFKGFSSPVSE